VTGANRGIGLGLVTTLLQRPHTTLIGTIRNSQAADVFLKAIESIQEGEGSRAHVAMIGFSRAPEPTAVHQAISHAGPGINHVNVVICNAGHSDAMTPSLTTTAQNLCNAFEINTIGPLMTFQGLWPLLQESSSPKLIVVTSSLGSIAGQEPVPSGGYGPSKAAVNWIANSLHLKMPGARLVSLAIHPGFVKTHMGAFAAKEWNDIIEPNLSVEESVKGILNIMDGATREKYSGKFMMWDGTEGVW
jgi:NAD(P)-dependent dehydrogenase (short-subunit alcohol dehydrogenase family)